jgi:hypothetical protein
MPNVLFSWYLKNNILLWLNRNRHHLLCLSTNIPFPYIQQTILLALSTPEMF